MQLRKRNEEGFTLIELMVVVMIIAILIAIAVPTFLGARKKAQDSAAKADTKNALQAEGTYFADNETYTATPADLEEIEPSLEYVTAVGGLTGPGHEVYVAINAAGDVVTLGSESASGKCFWAQLSDDGQKFSTSNDCTVPADGTFTAEKL